jgi:hypothetical protein
MDTDDRNHPATDVPRFTLPRRTFLKGVLAGAGALTVGPDLLAVDKVAGKQATPKPDYRGPNIILVRFGGGVRRRETVDAEHTYAPFFCHELTKRGTLFKKMEIDFFQDINTSHGEGTLYLTTGKYEKFKDVTGRFLGGRFEASVPTVFEYLRKAYQVPSHQTLIVNGEDRGDEEFYNFSNHHLFGARYRSNTLSLRRYKTFLLRRQIEAGKWAGKELAKKQADLEKMESIDYRHTEANGQGPELDGFWQRWREFYGETGLVNPRGDRLLTELTIRALKELRPKLIMVNYNDPDYVHWGNMTHYTRGVAVIDEGLRQLVATVEADPEYRDNTIFAVVPDCGRDSNPYVAVPCQHHFNSRSAHEIFALFFGPGIQRGAVVDKRVDQIQVAATIGRMMQMQTEFAEKRILEEVFA